MSIRNSPFRCFNSRISLSTLEKVDETMQIKHAEYFTDKFTQEIFKWIDWVK